MKKSLQHFIPILILGTALSVVHASAIPVYARQYRLSCSACHSPVPKLTAFGREFESNGFQFKGLESAENQVQTDDSSLSLVRELPLAIRLDGYSRIQPNDDQTTDIAWPSVMKIFSSGQLKSDISYFFYFLMNEGGAVEGVEDAYLYFNNVAGLNLDLTVGQFQIADMMVPRELRPTFEDYHIYELKPGLTKTDLTYDRGIMLNYSLPTETGFILSVVNGNGIGESSGGFYDSDPYKNIVGRVEQQVGSSVTLGTLGYLGKERTADELNRFSMLGGDATLAFDRLELVGQYIRRHDANPFFLSGRDSVVNSWGGFAQLMYAPQREKSDWYLFLLYNNVRSDIEELNYESVAGNVTFMVSRNFKLSGEYGYDLERKKPVVTLGFMTAF